jgi:cytochrome c oxidase subunit 2
MLALPSVIDPAGPQAVHLARLWWWMFGVTTVVFVVVMAALGLALVRGRRRARAADARRTSEGALTRAVAASVGLTVVILFGLVAASVRADRAVLSLGASSAVTLSVVGHQWWWEIEYEDAVASRRVTTANDIHIPTGRPVVLKVTSRDVIHSFWAPNLHGKRDLGPGYTTAIWIQADTPGVFRGQCAEFCGRQHAHMAFTVIAEPNESFERWLDAQRQPASEPESDELRRGRDVFMASKCSTCHRVRGTDASAQYGPDLTHVASRSTLAAGTLPNTREHLAQWVVNPQAPKPGNLMPPTPLAPDDLQALVAYLGTLR